MVEKCRILYKGDLMASGFYFLVGVILCIFAIVLNQFAISAGFRYLSVGFFMFFVYCFGKGGAMYYVSLRRYRHYKNMGTLDAVSLNEEKKYTEYRIQKKNINRRRYIYTIIASTIIAFLGLFSQAKGILTGTAIPIALIAAIDFSIGLLTEFRLREYLRILSKYSDGQTG